MRVSDDQINRAWARLQSAAPGAKPVTAWVTTRGQVVLHADDIPPSAGAVMVGAFIPAIALADFADEVQHIGQQMTAELAKPVLRAIKLGCNTHRRIEMCTNLGRASVRYRLHELLAAGLIAEGPETRCDITQRPVATFQIATQGEAP